MKTSKRIGKHRISMDMPENLFEIVKQICHERDTTVTKYILKAVCHMIKTEKDIKVTYK